jgi:HEAT repeat protein
MKRLLMLLALVGVGCKHKPAGPPPPPPDIPPRLGQVVVQDRTPDEALPPGARVDPEALSRELRDKLAAAGVFAPPAPDGAAGAVARVRADLALEEVRAEDKAAARAVIRFRVEPRPPDGVAPHWTEDVQAGAETTYALTPAPDRKALFTKLAARTLGDLASGYLARQKLWSGSADDVRSALAVETGDLRIEAIRAVAQRHLTSEVPALLKLLSDDDETVRDAALGALVELHDRRAVTEIAKQKSMRDRREMRKILDAIAMLGGQEASEYLAFVADTHEDEEIRQMAKQALERLKRRADAK